MSSLACRQDTTERLTALIDHIEAKEISRTTPSDTTLRARIPANGFTRIHGTGLEWICPGGHGCVAFVAGQTDFGTDAALQSAWRSSDATLAAAAVPTPDERKSGTTDLLDPVARRKILDWNQFQQDAMADEVLYYAHVVRQVTHGRKLSVFFYGYLYEIAGFQNGGAVSGHFALRRILDSPDIDCIASPLSYFDRGLMGSGPLMYSVGSDALAGKLYISEDDTATDLSQGNPAGYEIRAQSVDETKNILLRSCAEMTLENLGTWWMDLGPYWESTNPDSCTGWFDNPEYWNMLARFKPVEQELLRRPHPYRPEIASVIDEQSIQLLGYRNHVRPLISSSRYALGRVGAPYAQYMQDDVAAGRVHARLYVFLTA